MLDQNSKDLENLKFLLLGLDWHGPTPVVGGRRLSEPGWGNESPGKCEDGKKNLEELVVWKLFESLGKYEDVKKARCLKAFLANEMWGW